MRKRRGPSIDPWVNRKFGKVSKYYVHGYMQNFLLLFMSLLTALIVKMGHIFGCNLLYLSKNTSCTKLESLSIPNLDGGEKMGKEVIK